MSARDAMAAMLDELMGPKRNIELGKDTKVSFDDPNICPYYIVGFCPHDMFTNTKADLGACPSVHDDNLRRMYPTSAEYGKLGFEKKLLRFLVSLEDENQRRIRKNKDKLKGVDEQGQKRTDEERMKIEKELAELEIIYKAAMKEAEKAGTAGLVKHCQELVDKAEAIECHRGELRNKIAQLSMTGPLAPMIEELNVKPMEVCETCGSMLIVNDAAQRVEEHLTGKMHTGFQKIRASIEELKEVVKGHEDKAIKEREREREAKGTHRDRDRERKRSGSRERKERKRSRSRERDRSSRHSSSRHDDGRRDRGSDKRDDRRGGGDRDRDRDRDRRGRDRR